MIILEYYQHTQTPHARNTGTALQQRVRIGGVNVGSMEINELNYAPEIASGMLKKQQAMALVAARHVIVDGATEIAKNFLNISGEFTNPEGRHPKRPIEGLEFERQEISGTRLWGLLKQIWKTPEEIHKNVFLVNHCPLLLLGETGRNITPDNVSGPALKKLMKTCDKHLLSVVKSLGIKRVVGVGKYAEKRARIGL